LKPSGNSGGLGAKVIVVEPTGAEIHIYADLAGEEVCAVTQDRLQLDPGDEVRLMPLLDRVHLFDQATGKALAA
jgi:multiple sugar transport system ATP-binding protein